MQVTAIFLLIISTLIHQFEGVFIKKYNSKHKQGGFLFTGIISFFAMIFFIVTDKNGFRFPAEIFPYAIISGILYCSASILTYISLECGSYVMSNLILSYSLLFTIGYGLIYLHEPATGFTYAGLLIILISLFLVRGDDKQPKNKFSVKWVICIMLSAAGSGMLGIVSRMQQIKFDNLYTNEYMIIQLGLSAIVLFITGLIKEGKDLKEVIRYGGKYAVLAGLSNGATNFTSLIVNMLIPISLKSPLNAGIKIVFSFILGKLLFKENFLKRQIIGVILGGIALVLLNIKI